MATVRAARATATSYGNDIVVGTLAGVVVDAIAIAASNSRHLGRDQEPQHPRRAGPRRWKLFQP
jgi:hypothetical protein